MPCPRLTALKGGRLQNPTSGSAACILPNDQRPMSWNKRCQLSRSVKSRPEWTKLASSRSMT